MVVRLLQLLQGPRPFTYLHMILIFDISITSYPDICDSHCGLIEIKLISIDFVSGWMVGVTSTGLIFNESFNSKHP